MKVMLRSGGRLNVRMTSFYSRDRLNPDHERAIDRMALLCGLELMALLTVARLGEQSYGMFLCREIRVRTGRRQHFGAVYKSLQRLEEKGLVVGSSLAGGAPAGQRVRRFFVLTGQGRRCLRHNLAATDALRDGLDGLDHPAAARARLA